VRRGETPERRLCRDRLEAGDAAMSSGRYGELIRAVCDGDRCDRPDDDRGEEHPDEAVDPSRSACGRDVLHPRSSPRVSSRYRPQTMTAPDSATPRPIVIATSAPIMFSTGARASGRPRDGARGQGRVSSQQEEDCFGATWRVAGAQTTDHGYITPAACCDRGLFAGGAPNENR